MTHIAIIVAAAAAALAVALLFGAGALMLRNRRSSVSARLQRWSGSPGAGGGLHDREKKKHKAHGDLTAVRGFVVEQVNRAVARQSFAEKIRRRLARADLKITVGEFLTINAGATLLGVVVGWFVFGTYLHTVVCTAAGLILPHWYVRMKQRGRLKKFNNQLGDTIAMLANSLRSGYSMLQSMDLVGREMAPPISDEFQRVTREVGLGLTPEEALANLVRRINSMDLELMVTAINVQREVGGNLAEILDIIANTIRERVKLQGEIKTLTAQQTMAGYVITGLPVVLFFFLYTIDPKYMSTFWTWLPCGLIMGLGSIVMMGIGYFVMRKIVAIEV
jgi:tight adherence protein B